MPAEKTVNRLILEAIHSDPEGHVMKSFLINILTLEQKHALEAQWRFREDYERVLKRAVAALPGGAADSDNPPSP